MLIQTIFINQALSREIAIEQISHAINAYRDEIDRCRFNFSINHSTTSTPRLSRYNTWRNNGSKIQIRYVRVSDFISIETNLTNKSIWFNSLEGTVIIVEPNDRT